MQPLSASARKVQQYLRDAGFPCSVRELPDSTRSAAEAAQAIGCRVAQIVKSLVFRGKQSGRAVLAAVSGANRVDVSRLSAIAGENLEKADADFVREMTGFAIGGVPPAGHKEPLFTVIDRDLLEHGELWAAAGTPFAVFALSAADLLKMTAGKVADIGQRPEVGGAAR